MRPLTLLAVAGLLLAVAESLRASPALADLPGPVFRLEYKVMPGMNDCPNEDYTRGIFTVHFGYDPFSADSKTTLSVVARRKPGKLRVDVSTRNEAGATTWTSSYEENVHCWALIMSAAYMAEDEFLPPPSPPVCPACPAPAPPAPPPCSPAPAASPAPPVQGQKPGSLLLRRASWLEALRFEASAGLSGAYGIPPGVSLGPVLGLGARLSELSFGIGLDARFALSADLDQDATVPTSTYTAEAFACLHRKWFLGCGLLGFGHLALHPDKAISKLDAEPNFLLAGLRFGGEWPISGRYRLRTYLDGFYSTSIGIELPSRASPEVKQLVWVSPPVFVTVGIAGVVTF